MRPLPVVLSITIAAFAVGSTITHSAIISIPVSEWTDFSMDIDNDGFNEIEGGSFSSSAAGFLFTIDAVEEDYAAEFPHGETSVFGIGQRFSSLAELQSDPVWSGDLLMGESTSRMYNNFTGIGSAVPDEPVYAIWHFGTHGAGNEPLSLVGYVFDFSRAFESGGQEDILLAHHFYGYFEGGDFASDLSLAATGIPEPRYAAAILSLIGFACVLFYRIRYSVRRD